MTFKTKLLNTVAVVGLISGSAAIAEQHTSTEMAPETAEAPMMEGYPTGWNQDLDTAYGDIADRPVAELIGMNVVTEGGDDVGEVDNFVIIEDELKAVIGVGGFLGLGEHEVALGLGEVSYDGEKLIIAYTAEELEAMPEYTEELEQTALAETDTFRTRGDALATGTGMAVATDTEVETDTDASTEMAEAEMESDDPAAEEMAEAREGEIEQEAEEVAAEADAAMDNAAEETQEMASDAATATENAAEEAGNEMAEAADATENAVEGAAEETAQMAADATEATGDAMEDAGEELAEGAEATGDAIEDTATAAAATTGTWMDKLENEFAQIAEWEVDEIEGTNVVSANGEVIGEVDNLGMMGDKLVAIVGIGGFLGLGEHDVALGLDELGWDGENFVARGYSEEELKTIPEYQPDSVEMLDDDVTLRSQASM